jgi:pimeloyl-ACP methyl ester carboxylesterase
MFVEDDQEKSNAETQKRRGAERSLEFQNSTAASSLPEHSPETHYVQNGDVNIAYQVIGSGDLDIVFVMGWVSHLEYFWKHHLFASFLNRLASFSRLILFDKRGTGLSDRVPLSELPTLEQRMEDVHAVMDAVGSEKAVLIGVSEGGPMCSLFAATYPEKTTALVMIGTYAKRIRDEDYPWGVSQKDREAFFDLMRRDWGKAVGIEERAPSMAFDEEFRDWWATYLRMGASPGAAVALTQMNAEIDVRDVLPSIRVPTLVIHRKGDLCLKVEEGRFVAAQIPGSKFVELGGIDHLPFVGEQEEILDEIEEFLTGMRHSEEIDRVLATVLNIKIVPNGNTENWRKVYENAQVHFRRQLELFKGREVSFEEDNLLAAFDGPARAIRCACSINESAKRLGLEIKSGLHTGECEVFGDKHSGFAVTLAQNIADESATGEILVSRTVKDLVAGSGISFSEYGIRAFPDTQSEWRLFNVRI